MGDVNRWDFDLRDGLRIVENGDWVRYDDHEYVMGKAAAALSEAQATIARLEALLHEARIFVGYALLDGDRDALELSERIDAALSPREGEG